MRPFPINQIWKPDMRKVPILTMTGVDKRTDPAWMRSMWRKYRSNLEFALLLSARLAGHDNRYPAASDIREIIGSLRPGDPLAFHLCGRYARQVAEEACTDAAMHFPLEAASRIQVNLHINSETDHAAIRNVQRFSAALGVPVILQCRDGYFPFDPTVQFLQDLSGGRGQYRPTWFKPDSLSVIAQRPIGFAGGLSPENIQTVLPAMARNAGKLEFWVDCESSLRTDDWFSRERAEAMAAATFAAASAEGIVQCPA